MKFYNKTDKNAQVWVYYQTDPGGIGLWSTDLKPGESAEFSRLLWNASWADPIPKNVNYRAKVVIHYNKMQTHWQEDFRWNHEIDFEKKGNNDFSLEDHFRIRYEVKKLPVPHEGIMKFGIGKVDITPLLDYEDAGPAKLTGWGDVLQGLTGVEQKLYSRAFIIEGTNGKRSVIVVADIWSCSSKMKKEVIRSLNKDVNEEDVVYAMENVLITGTHTHSAPGGYTGSGYYDKSCGGWHDSVFQKYVDGIVASIKNAEKDISEGKIYLSKGEIEGCGKNRSERAYNNNPGEEKDQYNSNTDKEMLLLKFAREVDGGEIPWGALNWYAIHTTSRGQENTLINGDNKGWAEERMENDPDFKVDGQGNQGFISAFANSNCGDVSGNTKPDRTQEEEIENMKKFGDKQYNKAKELFNSTTNQKIIGPISYNHQEVDMSNVDIEPGKKTYIPAVGLSMFAGSTIDGPTPIGLKEGIIEPYEDWKKDFTDACNTTNDPHLVSVTERITQGFILAAFSAVTIVDVAIQAFSPALSLVTSTIKLIAGTRAKPLTDLTSDEVKGHLPKPITLIGGGAKNPNDPFITPHVLPLQLFTIGNFAIAGLPGEFTTMAGRRLRKAILERLFDASFSNNDRTVEERVKALDTNVALTCFTNDYCQYTTTPEEYKTQHYEGASTLFGPYTLDAYIKLYKEMAESLKKAQETQLA